MIEWQQSVSPDPGPGHRGRAGGGALLIFLGTILLIGVAAGAVYFFYCPCERTPGGWLLGEVVEEPVSDWSFANDVPLCQIQVYRGFLPHSINLNCMASDGDLYLSCASCQGKVWSTAALAHPESRLRVGDKVYPVRLLRVAADPRRSVARPGTEDRSGSRYPQAGGLVVVPGGIQIASKTSLERFQ